MTEARSNVRERRTSPRRMPRTGVRIALRSGTLGLGPDIATGLLDVSEDGLCVQLKSPIAQGSDAEIILERVGNGRAMKLIGDVRWCVGDGATGYRAGLRLRRRLPYKELMDLARN
ncbi:MAG TPA: PilZ domain-containing protein [Gemmataceae bacterium]|nr:PilZ domain-containing protein [Gemmataceae bacterium]